MIPCGEKVQANGPRLAATGAIAIIGKLDSGRHCGSGADVAGLEHGVWPVRFQPDAGAFQEAREGELLHAEVEECATSSFSGPAGSFR